MFGKSVILLDGTYNSIWGLKDVKRFYGFEGDEDIARELLWKN